MPSRKSNLYRFLSWFAALLLFIFAGFASAKDISVGVYYFPGWKDNQLGAAYAHPWDKIMLYPEREPLLGWYKEGDDNVMRTHLQWMRRYGIDFVTFDWYWNSNNTPLLSHAIDAYLRQTDNPGVNFSIIWCNHTDTVFTREQFKAMFAYWSNNYFPKKTYQRIDNIPVVYIFSAQTLDRNAQSLGMTTPQFAAWANDEIKRMGGPGVQFIGGTWGANPNANVSDNSGYAGFTAYNYQNGVTLKYPGGHAQSHSYAELDQGYRDQWNWMMTHASGTFVLPMTSGWDKTPWGGTTSDPQHDLSVSTPESFAAHLRAAKQALESVSNPQHRIGIICCWNEFGEGSYIEPTMKFRFQYLEAVKAVFGVKGQPRSFAIGDKRE